MLFRSLAAAALALALVAPATAAPRRSAARSTDWTRMATMTADGGIRIGNPAARVRLVEYGSFTCPHCAAFAAEAMPDIRRWVHDGVLRFELRPYPREEIDLTAALAAQCAGTAGFFGLADDLFARQMAWIGRAQAMTSEQIAAIDRLPPDGQFRAVAHATGIDGIAKAHGIDGAALDRCLGDKAAIARIVAAHDRADRQYDITATPMFLLNGTLIRSADWKGLKPQVQAAIGGG